MQLVHDVSALHERFNTFIEFHHSLSMQVKKVEFWVVGYDRLLHATHEWETKLKEEFATLQNFSEAITWKIEAWVVKKEGSLTEK